MSEPQVKRELLVEYDEKSMVMTVSINRPARGNSLSGELVRELLALVRDVSATFEARVLNISENAKSATSAPLVRVFVLTAVGKIFCSGMDLKSAQGSANGVQSTEITIALFDAIRSMPMPTVLLLNGPALGGGTVFAFLVDFVLSVRSAYVQFSEVKIGLLPAMISCFIVPRIGTAQAGAMMLSGRRYQIDELHRSIGGGGIALVSSDAADADELRAAGGRFVQEHLLTSSSFASSHMKRLIAYVSTHSHADNCNEAQRAFATVFAGEDMRYGLECFGKKEKPNWTNRLKARL